MIFIVTLRCFILGQHHTGSGKMANRDFVFGETLEPAVISEGSLVGIKPQPRAVRMQAGRSCKTAKAFERTGS